VLGCLVCVLRLREREEFRDRGPRHPYEAFVGVWQNPHARILLSVFLIQQLGIATLTTCMPFYAQYVLEAPERTFVYIGAMLGASILGVPLWMRFAPRFEKKTGLVFAMASIGIAISLLGFTQPGDDFPVIVIAIVGGLLAAGTDVLFPSLQADVIDYDELRSGKRREGAYFSAWAFAAKSASAVSAMVVGFALQSMDFVPNAEQTESVRLGLRFITGFVPALLWGLGIVIFLRFSLDEREHRRILQGLGRA